MPPAPQDIAEKLKALGVPQAAGLAAVYAFCIASDFTFPTFVLAALASNLVVESVRGICRRLAEGAAPKEMQGELEALGKGEKARALEELVAVVTSIKDEVTDQLSEQLREYIQKEMNALQDHLDRKINEVEGAAPFTIHGSIAGLLSEVSRVANHGLVNVVDRPESNAIISALQGKITRQLFLKGRALSGKTFLAFKVAAGWILSGGQAAWMCSGNDVTRYVSAIQKCTDYSGRLPLIVWEVPPRSEIKEEVFDQLQRYDGPVIITVRVGGLHHQHEDLDDLLEDHGFVVGGLDTGCLIPTARKVSAFLGPIANPFKVISANVRAGHYYMTITDEAKAAIASHILVGADSDRTTLLGLCKAYLMASDHLGINYIDLEAVFNLEGPNRLVLSAEQLVKKIFENTVGDEDKNFLSVLRLYKTWTFEDAIHEDILTATIQAYRQITKIPIVDRRNQLTKKGVLLHRKDRYSVWHDLQLDILEETSTITANDVLSCSVELLKREIEHVPNERKRIQMVSAVIKFASILAKNRYWDEAYILLTSAITIVRAQAIANPNEFNIVYLAGTSNNLGLLLSSKGEWPQAREYYKESLDLRRKLAKEKPKVYLPDLATTCNNFGNLLAKIGEWPQAKELIQEALEINRKLAEEQPRAYLPNVAGTCNNLGILLADRGEWPQARKFYQEALDLRRKLAKEQPKAQLPDLAATCNNLGILLVKMDKWPQARELFQETLQYYRKLAEDQPKAYLPALATAYHNLGNLLYTLSKWPEARQFLQEALRIRRNLAEEQPKAYLLYVARTCSNLAVLLTEMGKYSDAARLFTEAISIEFRFYPVAPRSIHEQLVVTFTAMHILAQKREFSDRENWLQQTWHLLHEDFKAEIINICKPLGDLFKAAGFPVLALEPYLFATLLLKKTKNPEAAQANIDVERLRDKIGPNFKSYCEALEKKFAPILEMVKSES